MTNCEYRNQNGNCIVLNGKQCAAAINSCIHRLRADCKQLKNLLEEAAEEIENCYGRETELSERLRAAL